MTRDELWVCHLGTIPYLDAVALQEHVRARRQTNELPDTLLLLEHPPVYTRGRRPTPAGSRLARTSPAPAGSTLSRPTAVGASPTTVPASSSAIRSWESPTSAH